MKPLGPGSKIAGRYVLESVLARGGMGAVYRAVDERLGRAVALKVLLAELAEDSTSIARFEREASSAARLSHPGIVQVFDFGTFEDVAFMVMEQVGGRTLAAELTSQGRLAPARAADVVEQALGAIAAAHAAGIVHRDLKPGNLMLVPVGEGGREIVKVLDFGIAQLKESATYARLTQTGVVLGTPTFMSPEQARGERCDARTDVYAMGVVLWCCLTGQRPFAPRDMASIIECVLGEMPTRADRLFGDVPAVLALAADRAMAKPPEARWQSASAFAAALVDTRGAFSTGASSSRASIGSSVEPPTAVTVRGRPLVATPAPMAPMTTVPSGATYTSVPTRTITASGPTSAVPPTPAAAPVPTSSRFWLRVSLGLVALLVLALGALGVVVAVGVYELRERPLPVDAPIDVRSWPSMHAPGPAATTPTHPAPQGMTPVCAATYRCCMRAGQPESTCDLYGTNPPTCEIMRTQLTQVLAEYGVEPSMCSALGDATTSAGARPTTIPSEGASCARARACCEAYRARVNPQFPDCDTWVGFLQGDEALCTSHRAMLSGSGVPECD